MSIGFDFSGLSPDLCLDAIESLAIYPSTGLLPLNSYENRVYQFGTDDGKRYVVKFYRPQRWTQAQINEELNYASELAEAEIPVVAPLKHNGQLLHEFAGFSFSITPSVGGRTFELDNEQQLLWVGRFLGRIHAAAKASTFEFRPTISIQEFGDDALAFLKASGFIPDFLNVAFFTVAEQVLELSRSQIAAVDYQNIRLHGDCHASNIMWADGPLFVDFDDCRMGPAIQDLWMLMPGDKNEQLLALDIILEGYEEFSDFDTRELALIEPLRALRMLNYMAWLARRWDDPAFKQNFPWFYLDRYWEDQTLALKEQLWALQSPALSLDIGGNC